VTTIKEGGHRKNGGTLSMGVERKLLRPRAKEDEGKRDGREKSSAKMIKMKGLWDAQ